MYQCSIGNLLREDLQFYREENKNLKEDIITLTKDQKDAEDKADYFETEMEHWRNSAKYWSVRADEMQREIDNLVAQRDEAMDELEKNKQQ